VVDLRKGSPMYGRHILLELNANERNILYLPSGLAHGFYVLSPSATVMYKVSSLYAPDHDGGIHWSSAGIAWPDKNPTISDRDIQLQSLSDFDSPF
jgi:dTDP-4-dehydrorhamnose 3,5-epimerase